MCGLSKEFCIILSLHKKDSRSPREAIKMSLHCRFLAEATSPLLLFSLLFLSRILSSDTCLAFRTYLNVNALRIFAPALGFFTFSVCTFPSMMMMLMMTPSHSRGSSARYNKLSCTHTDVYLHVAIG